MKKLLSAALCLLTVALFAVCSYAQVTTSSIAGRVADRSGEALQGAVISAVHAPTGTKYYAVAGETGQFSINSVRIGGPYTIEVQYLGMNTVRYENITLKLGEPYEISVLMDASNSLDAVVVVAESDFNASKTGAGASFSLRQVETMPSIDRSVFDVVKYTPQASQSKTGGISIAGASSRYNSFQIDGAVANDSFGLSSEGTNGAMVGANPISLDAIEEIQVVVAPFDVRQNGFTGGGINAITKSGTNTVKGTFYARYFNQDFIGTTPGTTDWTDTYALSTLKKVSDGNGGYLPEALRTKYDEEVSETYGFTVGAPIVRNKLFLFLSGEYHNISQPNIYSPLNDSYVTEERKLKVPISIGGVEHEYFDTDVAKEVIDHYIEYYSNGGYDVNGKKVTEGYAVQNSNKTSLSLLARVDWNISDAHKFMLRYQLLDASSESRSQGAKTYYFNNSNNDMVNRTHNIVMELDSRLSDRVSNEMRATAVLVNEHREVPYALPTIYTSGDNTIIDLGTHYCSYINKTETHTYTFTDNVLISSGDHHITLGTYDEAYTFANAYRTYATGQFVFGTLASFLEQTPGNITASSFLYKYADPQVEGVTGPDWYATTTAMQLGLYAQDEWKPGKDFSLTYGIRADMPVLTNTPSVNEEYNAGAATYSTDAGEQVGIVPDPTVLWSPRLGFRWFPSSHNHKLLIRGGAGLFTGRIPFVWLSNAYNNTGVETKSISITDKNMLKTLPITTDPYNDIVLGNKYTWYSSNATGAAVDPSEALAGDGSVKEGYTANKGVSGSNAGATINTLSKNFKYPQVFRANLALDYEFGDGLKTSLEALYSKSFNNVYFRNIALESTSSFYPVSQAAAAANPVAQAPFYRAKTSSYQTIISLGNTDKGYSYSLSYKIQKHFEWGLDLMGSYTFGHSYSCNDGMSSQAASNLSTLKAVDVNNPELSYSIFDNPHKVNAVVSWTSPTYGMCRTTVALTYTGTSGMRYSYTYKDATDTDINGDYLSGNTLMYIPTTSEVFSMNYTKPEDAYKVEAAIKADSYLNSHRGQWSERNAGISGFENHFDLQVTEDIFFNRESGRKLQVTLDLINASNLLNRNWGLYYASSLYKSILSVDAQPSASNNYTPKYSYNADNAIYLSDFYSRWRCQLGVRLTF